ncbi:hypothetical protein Pcinc_008693 [Petrolisthes cinctipes]|uniref:NADH dehydrogenase [ubiquinone] flavoprotein 3, mitochondrial n=1 Tax=Petrolisthes cinctipes TaxID=88211 RepID=A0AAE1KZ82_PETCI|nr:hypothetical protein Pcinc_008693 [Petrolisthes cinctipes]
MATLYRLFRAGKTEAPILRAGLRGFCSEGPKTPPGQGKAEKPTTATPPPAAAAPPPPPPAAPVYQSAATPDPPSQPVGPGADKSGAYPNTEYYCYNKDSYFELEVEMAQDRVPQPAADNGHF